MPEYHKRGSRNTTHMLFQNPENRRTFAASIRTNSLMPIMTGFLGDKFIYLKSATYRV